VDNSKPIDPKTLESMNEKAIRNSFFTPDHVYIELGLLKDFAIGAVYTDLVVNQSNPDLFKQAQSHFLTILPHYQSRLFDTVEPWFTPIGYTDQKVDQLIADPGNHDRIFLLSPTSKFLETLIKETFRNINHSGPANKVEKAMISAKEYVLNPLEITYTFNTYPLKLSPKILASLAVTLGESLGVNIRFIAKDPDLFDADDWQSWMNKIDCFYLNDTGRFVGSQLCLEKIGNLEFMGRYLFGRKRLQREYKVSTQGLDLNTEFHRAVARLGMMCDFDWMPGDQCRLTENKENSLST
jgi:hypothetical protein